MGKISTNIGLTRISYLSNAPQNLVDEVIAYEKCFQGLYMVFLESNRSSKVSHLKNMKSHTIYVSIEERVTPWLSFDILLASSLPRITELDALKGDRYKIKFVQVLENQKFG